MRAAMDLQDSSTSSAQNAYRYGIDSQQIRSCIEVGTVSAIIRDDEIVELISSAGYHARSVRPCALSSPLSPFV